MGKSVAARAWSEIKAADGAMTIVNTTALGMVGKPPLTISLDAAPAGATVVDIVYNPLDTDFLLRARQRKLRRPSAAMMHHRAHSGKQPVVRRDFKLKNMIRQIRLV